MPFILLALALLAFMCLEALSFTAMAAVFFDLGLWDGWHAAWDQPLWLFLFSLVSFIFAARGT